MARKKRTERADIWAGKVVSAHNIEVHGNLNLGSESNKISRTVAEEVSSARSLAELALNLCSSVAGKAYDHHLADSACAKYYDKYKERHGLIRILGMRAPIPLETMYVDLRLASSTHLRRFSTPEGLQEAFADRPERSLSSFSEQGLCSGLTIANTESLPYINLLGAPGSGKSTFLRFLGMMALQGYRRSTAMSFSRDPNILPYHYNLLPVFVQLSRLREVNISTLIEDEFITCGFPVGFGTKALEKGGLLVLLDGLDEIPRDYLDKAIVHVRDFVDKYSDCRYVSSCRTAFYKTWFTRFTDFVLADWNNKQIRAFISNWFPRKEDQTNDIGGVLWGTIKDPAHHATMELARTPLLAAFLCMTYEYTGYLPNNRAELYGEALRILMEKWGSERRVHLGPVFEGLYGKAELTLLESIAGPAYVENKYFFSSQELSDQIEAFLKENIKSPDSVNGREILEEIEKKQGLLIQRAHDLYSFSHLTIHEYLAARYYQQSKKAFEHAQRHLFDDRWHEVLLLIAGLQDPDADEYLLHLSAKAANYLSEPASSKIAELIAWSERLTLGEKREEVALFQRVLALYFVLARVLDFFLSRGLDYARSRAKSGTLSDEKARTSCLDIAKALVPVLTQLFEITRCLWPNLDLDSYRSHDLNLARVREANMTEAIRMVTNVNLFHDVIRRKLQRIRSKSAQSMSRKILQALAFPDMFKDLTPSDYEKLNTYFRAINRIIRCREAAQRVTKSGWKNVASCLFQTRTPVFQIPQENVVVDGESVAEPYFYERALSLKHGFVTERAKRTLGTAHREAERMNHEYIGTEHLLLGLAKEESCLASLVLSQEGISSQMIEDEIMKIVQEGPDDPIHVSAFPLTPRLKAIIELSKTEAIKAHHNYLGTEHLLLGCILEREGVAGQILLNLGAKEVSIRRTIEHLLSGK